MNYIKPDFQASALVIIDVQNDYTLDGAPAKIEGTFSVLPAIASVLDAYRRAQLPIVHVVRLYRPDGSNVDACRRAAVESGVRVVTPGSAGSQIPDVLRSPGMPDLDHQLLLSGEVQKVTDAEVVIYKPRWGAFYQTRLHEHLNGLGIDTLVFCGCNFPNCPRASIYEASERDYRLVLAVDAISQIYDRGLAELKAIGVQLMKAADIRATLMANKSVQRTPLRGTAEI
jgi:nicotinamidase-related amidase